MKTSIKKLSDMKTISYLYLFLLLSFAINSKAQWNTVDYPSDKYIDFPQYTSSTKMWAIEYGETFEPHVVVTSNDGLETITRSTTSFRWIYFLYAITDKIAYLDADPKGSFRTQLYKTIDGGITWDSIMPRFGKSICFDTSNLAILGSSITNGCFDYYTSGDGGINWNKQTACPPILNGVTSNKYFMDWNRYSSTAILTYDSFYFKTNDYGKSWTVLNNSNYKNQVFRTMAFRDSLNGIAFKRFSNKASQLNYSTLHYTSDGGITWDSSTIIFPPIAEVRYVKKKNENDQSFYIAGGYEGAIYSNDSAINWKYFDSEMHSWLAFYNKESGLSFYPVKAGGKGLLKFVGPFTGSKIINNPIEQFSISIYPNPVINQLNITYTTSDNETELVVLDITGKVVKSFQLLNTKEQNNITVNTSDLGKGIYFLRASNLGTLKFVKN